MADAAALAAQNAVTTAFNALAGQACDVNLTGTDLGGLTLTTATLLPTSPSPSPTAPSRTDSMLSSSPQPS